MNSQVSIFAGIAPIEPAPIPFTNDLLLAPKVPTNAEVNQIIITVDE